ncbi:MAG: hypothetical protein EHM20_07100 [Alphaproteobacteria bacterium]|nr:MAG: hypothetical protein EHM20_07100 [Alphaproteobacteria bacterium]
MNEEEYLNIITKKTATLIAACTACGARSVTEDENQIRKMKEFGLKIGIAFQIKDDLFDYEKTTRTGKPKGNDIQEKKLTLPLIASLAKANKRERKEIINLINKKSSKRDTYDRVFKFVHEMDGLNYSKNLMSKYQEEALAILYEYPESPVRTSLEKLVYYIVSREN